MELIVAAFFSSHPSRVRGLKWAVIDKACQDGKSHPSRVRGLKSGSLYRDTT